MIRQRGIFVLLVVAFVVAACGADSSAPSPSTAQADVSLAPSTSPEASASPSPSPTPAATPTALATPTPVPTATPLPTPKPTPTPWLSYKSKRFHYSIKYPPEWIVTPGSADIADQFDGFAYPYVYVSRDTVPTGSYVSVSKTVTHDIAYWKSHYKATLTSNKAIKLAGWSGRLLTFRGTDDGRTVFFQHIILAKGRVGYFLDMYGKNEDAVADRALFKKIYMTWRPT